MTDVWRNDFDKAFDEAVDELAKKAEAEKAEEKN